MYKNRHDAIKNGAYEYYTGKPCKSGHMSYRYTINGACSTCTIERAAHSRKEQMRIFLATREERIKLKMIENELNAIDTSEEFGGMKKLDLIEHDDKMREVFEYWQQVMNYPERQLIGERKRRLKAALKNYTVEQLKAAIDGCAKSDFHMGKNKNKELHNDLELIVRDEVRTDKFITNSRLIKKTLREIEIENKLKNRTYKSAFSSED